MQLRTSACSPILASATTFTSLKIDLDFITVVGLEGDT